MISQLRIQQRRALRISLRDAAFEGRAPPCRDDPRFSDLSAGAAVKSILQDAARPDRPSSQKLAAQVERRKKLPMPGGDDSALFTTRTGKVWPYQHVITLFERLHRAACIECLLAKRGRSRLHDLRHTAAIHRGHGAGKDVQHPLPQLATYLRVSMSNRPDAICG